ncbi:MAG TPA: hypothetical protein VHY09_16190 [Candidatus Methylacidiphilales bacterium]|jgi:hypothetical protein|nr:hypothetical protein [Candidatus Methylacidiphilales bacterium]
MAGTSPASAPRPLRRLLLQNLGVTAAIFALLECWRPLFFLTDDNLDGAFPLFTGIGRRLMHGQSPFVSDDLFGGHYNLLRDSSDNCWHPLYILAALLTQTPARFLVIDLLALIFLLLAAAGFVCLADFLRRENQLPLGDARLTLCAQSFTFSMLVLCAGSSWITFLANNSALPWLALGVLQTRWRRGLGLTTLFSLHQLAGGHPGVTVSSTIFLTLFALGVAWQRRSALPLLLWFGGVALAVLIHSPLLFPAVEGFFRSGRAAGFGVENMDRFAFPALLLPLSYFLGIFSWRLGIPYHFGFCPPLYAAAFASCAAAWVLVPALASRARWRGLEVLCLGLAAFAVLLAIRPAWLGEIMAHIPVLRAMRWPFREILQLQFFLHLFLILRPLGGPRPFQRLIIFLGIALFICPLFFLPAPSFNVMDRDRQLLFSGAAARYWDHVKTQLQPGEVIVPVMNPGLGAMDRYEAPYSLIGAYNYPELFAVTAAAGYTLTVPRDQIYLATMSNLNNGIYAPDQEAQIRVERPNARFITLESVQPLRLTLSSPSGPIDLTPFLSAP